MQEHPKLLKTLGVTADLETTGAAAAKKKVCLHGLRSVGTISNDANSRTGWFVQEVDQTRRRIPLTVTCVACVNEVAVCNTAVAAPDLTTVHAVSRVHNVPLIRVGAVMFDAVTACEGDSIQVSAHYRLTPLVQVSSSASVCVSRHECVIQVA